jgi:hypothetical protein
MSTKIKLETCLSLPGLDSEVMDLPAGVKSVSDLLRSLGKKIDFDFIHPQSGLLENDMEFLLNGKEIWFHPDGLNTSLKDGDIVEIYLIPIGGG